MKDTLGDTRICHTGATASDQPVAPGRYESTQLALRTLSLAQGSQVAVTH